MALTDKQLLFANEYLACDRNATEAAKRAGYSEKTAYSQGQRLLKNVEVSAYIDAKTNKIVDKLDLSLERLLAEYAKIGFSDIRAYYNEDGTLKNITELSDEAAGALAGVEIEEERDGDGNFLGYTKKLKLWDKRGSLDSMCKVLGYNAPEKIKHEIDGFNINIVE